MKVVIRFSELPKMWKANRIPQTLYLITRDASIPQIGATEYVLQKGKPFFLLRDCKYCKIKWRGFCEDERGEMNIVYFDFDEKDDNAIYARHQFDNGINRLYWREIKPCIPLRI